MSSHRAPTIRWSALIWMVGLMVVPVWVAPALYYNLHWGDALRFWDNVWAVTYVVGAATSFAALHVIKDWHTKLFAVLLGTVLICNNSWNAVETIAEAADHRIDGRSTEISGFSRGESERSGWSAIVGDAKKLVGTAPVAALQSEADGYIAKGAKVWRATEQCNPLEINRAAAFCAEVARLKARVATAAERDKAQAKIDAYDASHVGAKPPTNADPMAALFSSLMATFNVSVTADGQKGFRAWRGVWNTVALEAMAGVMPLIWVAIIRSLVASIKGLQRMATARATRQRNVPEKLDNDDIAPVAKPVVEKPTKITPEFERWCADELEEGATYSIGATIAHKQHNAWRKRHNMPEISQKRFGEMMGERFTRDKNHGYPRYLGAQASARKSPGLRVVQ